MSPTRTSALPLTVMPVEASGPMASGYGTPVTELTIWQIEPATASGMPLAVTNGLRDWMITPVSGAPAIPGVTITAQPMLTGGPGMVS